VDRLVEDVECSARRGSVLEIRMPQVLAYQAQGHRSLALDALWRALSEAPDPNGYVRLFLDEGAPTVSLLHDARERDNLADHARRLRTAGTATDEAPRPVVGTSELSIALLNGAGWMVNLAVAERAIRRRPAPPAVQPRPEPGGFDERYTAAAGRARPPQRERDDPPLCCPVDGRDAEVPSPGQAGHGHGQANGHATGTEAPAGALMIRDHA
jgi:hypothetical protein